MGFKSGVSRVAPLAKNAALFSFAVLLLANSHQAPATNNVNKFYNKLQSGAKATVNCVAGNKYTNGVMGIVNDGIDLLGDGVDLVQEFTSDVTKRAKKLIHSR
jgi:hypothetical protein